MGANSEVEGDEDHQQVVVNMPTEDGARVNVIVQQIEQVRRQARHHQQYWHQVHKPKLELEVHSRYQADASDELDKQNLNGLVAA